MKRTEILEIVVNNPQAVFMNASRKAGKYSEYPTYFQVLSMTGDKSYVRVQAVSATINDYLLDENGEWLRDEDNNVVRDTRTIEERTVIHRGRTQAIPTRLVLKSELTVDTMLSSFLETEIARQKEREERDDAIVKAEADAVELLEVLNALGITNMNLNYDGGINITYDGRATLQFQGENITRLVSALKSALTETKCKHCDATDSYNFGQCISCDEQQEVGV
jgi:hypothetical protein